MISRLCKTLPVFVVLSVFALVSTGCASLASSDSSESARCLYVCAFYPGANAGMLEKSVARPLESEFAAMDGILHYSSESGDSGKYRCVLTFKDGTDMDKNMVAVQSAVQRAEPKLPEKIRKSGIAIFRNAADTEKFPFSWDAE